MVSQKILSIHRVVSCRVSWYARQTIQRKVINHVMFCNFKGIFYRVSSNLWSNCSLVIDEEPFKWKSNLTLNFSFPDPEIFNDCLQIWLAFIVEDGYNWPSVSFWALGTAQKVFKSDIKDFAWKYKSKCANPEFAESKEAYTFSEELSYILLASNGKVTPEFASTADEWLIDSSLFAFLGTWAMSFFSPKISF